MTRKKVQLFNPRKQDWDEHFRWSNDGTQIIGQTSRQAQCIVVDPCSRVAVPFVSATEQVVSAAEPFVSWLAALRLSVARQSTRPD